MPLQKAQRKLFFTFKVIFMLLKSIVLSYIFQEIGLL